MNPDKILEKFPQMEEIYLKFYESFDSQKNVGVEEAMQSLLNSTKMYFQPILKKRNLKRAQSLLDALQSSILHLHMRRTGSMNTNFKSERYRALSLNLLAQLIDLYLLLSRTNTSFINQAAQALHIYTENNIMDMVCILLQCNLVKIGYSEICQPLLQHVLNLTPGYTLLPKDYLRCLYLLRLWDKCTKNKLEKSKIYHLASKLKVSKSHAAQLKSDFLEIIALAASCEEQTSIDQKWIHTFFLRRKFPSGFLQQLRKVLCEDFAVMLNQELSGGCAKYSVTSIASNMNIINAPNIEGHISFKSLSSGEGVQLDSSSEFQKVSNDENGQSIDDFPLFVIDTKRNENVVSLDEIAPETTTAASKKKSKKKKPTLVENVDHTISATSLKESISNVTDVCRDSKTKHKKKKRKEKEKDGTDGPNNENGKNVYQVLIKNETAVGDKSKKRKKRKHTSDNEDDGNAKSKKLELTLVCQNVSASDLKTKSNKSSLKSSKKTVNENIESKREGKSKNKKRKKEDLVTNGGDSRRVKKKIKKTSSKKCKLELPYVENELKNEMGENSDVFDMNAQNIEEENISSNSSENEQTTLGKRGFKSESLKSNKKHKRKPSTTVADCVETAISAPHIDQDMALGKKFKRLSSINEEYRSEIPCDDNSYSLKERVGENRNALDDRFMKEVNQCSPFLKMECESNDVCEEISKTREDSALLEIEPSLEQLTDEKLSTCPQQNDSTISSEVESAHTPNDKGGRKTKKKKSIIMNLSKAFTDLKMKADEQSFPSLIVEENEVSQQCSKDSLKTAVPNSPNQGTSSIQNVSNYLYNTILANKKELVSHDVKNTSPRSKKIRNLSSPKKQVKRMLKSPAVDKSHAEEVKDNSCDDLESKKLFLSSGEVKYQEKSIVYDSDGSERRDDVAKESDASGSSLESKIGKSFSQRACLNMAMAESLSISSDASPCKLGNKITIGPGSAFSGQKHDLENECNEKKAIHSSEVNAEPIVSTKKNNEVILINGKISPSRSDDIDINKCIDLKDNSNELSPISKNNCCSPSTELDKDLEGATGSIVSDSSQENSFAFDDSSISLEISSSNLSTELEKQFDIASGDAILDPSNKKTPLKRNLNNSKVNDNNIEGVVVPEDKIDEAHPSTKLITSDSKKSICNVVETEDVTLKSFDLASPSKSNCGKEVLPSFSSQNDDLHQLDINDKEKDKELINDSLKCVMLDQSVKIIESSEDEVDLVKSDSQANAIFIPSQPKNFKPIATISPMKVTKLPKSTNNVLHKAQESNNHNLLSSKKLVKLQNCLKTVKDSKDCDVIQKPSLQLSCHGSDLIDPPISNSHLANNNISCISTKLRHSSRIREKSKVWISNGLDFTNVGKMLSEKPQLVEEFPKPLTPSKYENKQRGSSSDMIEEDDDDDDNIFHSPTTSECESEALETLEEKPAVVETETIKPLTKTKPYCKTANNCSLVDYSLKNMYLNSPAGKTRSALTSEDCDCEIGMQLLRRSKRIRKLSSASDISQSESEDGVRPKPRKRIVISTTLKKIPEASPQVNEPATTKEESKSSRGYNLRNRKQLVAPSKLK